MQTKKLPHLVLLTIAVARNMSGKKALYDEDDFYDEDDADEDYYGDYGDFDPGESQLVGKQSSKTPAKVARFPDQRYSCKNTLQSPILNISAGFQQKHQ